MRKLNSDYNSVYKINGVWLYELCVKHGCMKVCGSVVERECDAKCVCKNVAGVFEGVVAQESAACTRGFEFA